MKKHNPWYFISEDNIIERQKFPKSHPVLKQFLQYPGYSRNHEPATPLSPGALSTPWPRPLAAIEQLIVLYVNPTEYGVTGFIENGESRVQLIENGEVTSSQKMGTNPGLP